MTLGDMLANFLAAAALRTVFNAAEPGGFSRNTKEGEAPAHWLIVSTMISAPGDALAGGLFGVACSRVGAKA